MGIMANTI